jgi:hypothetical protein
MRTNASIQQLSGECRNNHPVVIQGASFERRDQLFFVLMFAGCLQHDAPHFST